MKAHFTGDLWSHSLHQWPDSVSFCLSSLFQVKASQDPKQKQAFILTLLKEQIRATIASLSQVWVYPQNKLAAVLRGPKARGSHGKWRELTKFSKDSALRIPKTFLDKMWKFQKPSGYLVYKTDIQRLFQTIKCLPLSIQLFCSCRLGLCNWKRSDSFPTASLFWENIYI